MPPRLSLLFLLKSRTLEKTICISLHFHVTDVPPIEVALWWMSSRTVVGLGGGGTRL